ncbi:US12 family protein [Hymenobacter sp. PAMC 26628]|uniref:US12 family protein n=1 Tax=Hymenobacter sp. PAMC 26628 TaxID=1484118 RepID=UPI00076FFFDB|nr:US12 family protein [Hymenobacter sp. PAMC 26628]AMJ67421.1 hypothetical protein AXW84_19830 [Hymenobacter sp. PAMC 26628]
MEDYAAKMQAKSLAELHQYVSGYAQYRDDAVLAALAELRRRGQPAPEEDALRPGLETAVAQQRAADSGAVAAQLPVALDGPELYSQGAVVLFSMFSLLMGGVLLGINLHRLRRPEALARLILFILAFSFVSGYTISWALAQFSGNLLIPALLSLAFNVVGLLTYLAWFWPRYIGTQEYRSRSWLMPLVIFFAIWMVFNQIARPLLIKNGIMNAPAAVPTAPITQTPTP